MPFQYAFTHKFDMNPDLEKRLIISMYMEHLKQQREWFRFEEIAVLSGIGKSSLQRILPRMIKRGWIERQKSWSFSEKEPQGAINHLMGSAEVQNYKLPLLYLSDGNNNRKDGQRQRQRKTRRLVMPRPLFPKEVAEEYAKQLPSLERKVVDGMTSNEEVLYGKESYSEAEAKRLEQSRGKISKKAIRFRGQAELFEDAWKKMMAKEYVFYRVIVLPYFEFPVLLVPPSLRLKHFNWYNIPDDTKRFWTRAKQELIEEIKQYEKANPNIIL